MKKFFRQNSDFWGPIISIALPLALQNLIAASLNLVDNVMIGRLGQTEIAAVGLANQVFFILNLFLFGINSGAAIFTAQFWGQKDVTNIRRVLGVALISGIIGSSIFGLVSLCFPEWVMGIYTADPAVIARGSQFLKIIAWSYIMSAITTGYSFVLRSTGEVMLPVKIGALALLVNTVLNYLLIYGGLGLPRLEVRSSALATVIARLLELGLIFGMVYGKKMIPAATWSEMTDLTLTFVIRFFKTTVPVILNESLWAVGMTMFTIVYARMGTAVVAGFNIFSTIERLAFVLFFGLAQACAVTIGNDIGANEEDRAFTRAKQYSLLGPVLGLVIGWSLVWSAEPIFSLFKVSGAANEVAHRILLIFAIILPFRIFNLINIVGILRSGGDTRFSLFLDVGALWLIAVPISFLAGLVWHLPPHLVYLFAALEEVFKFVLGIQRLLSRKWIHNLTHSMREAAGEIGSSPNY